jgi:nicotinamide/nicotinate riboside kinase
MTSPNNSSPATSVRTLIIAISGPSCSGKTTLTKLIHGALPSHSQVLHQDDFYVPDPQIPNKTLPDGRVVADWDCAGALDIYKLASTLRKFKETGRLEGVDSIQDQQPEGASLEIDYSRTEPLTAAAKAGIEAADKPVKILLVDGFLLYGESVALLRQFLDLKLFIPTPYEMVKSRREARAGYVTIEGFWDDPEGYVDGVVWPNYVAEHSFLFEGRDVSSGVIHRATAEELGIQTCRAGDLSNIGTAFEWAMLCVVDKIVHGTSHNT